MVLGSRAGQKGCVCFLPIFSAVIFLRFGGPMSLPCLKLWMVRLVNEVRLERSMSYSFL